MAKATKTTYDTPKLEALVAACEASYRAFGAANLSARGRALENGRRLIDLRDYVKANKAAGLMLADVYARLKIPTSTATDHIRLAECWAEAESVCEACGVDFDTLTIREVIDLVDTGEWPGQAKKAASGPDGGGATTAWLPAGPRGATGAGPTATPGGKTTRRSRRPWSRPPAGCWRPAC